MVRKLILIGLTILAVATAVASVVCIWQPLYWDSVSPTGYFYVHLNRLDFSVLYVEGTDPYIQGAGMERREYFEHGLEPAFCFKWREYHNQCVNTSRIVSYSQSQVSVPTWTPLLLFAAYPAFAVVRGPLCRRWRQRRGCCARCGYNLTGNVSGVCPECGERI